MNSVTHDPANPEASGMTLSGTVPVPISHLTPYPQQARTHSKRQIRKIASSIERFGFVNPVLIDADLGIIAGHVPPVSPPRLKSQRRGDFK